MHVAMLAISFLEIYFAENLKNILIIYAGQ